MHTDWVLRREYAQVLRSRLGGTPGSALAAKVGELAQGHRRRLPSRSDERHQRGIHGNPWKDLCG